MNYTITPYKALGDISLGAHRKEIRELLKESYKEFYRSETAEAPVDFFTGLGLLVNYDEKLLCEAIEIVKPGNPILFTIGL